MNPIKAQRMWRISVIKWFNRPLQSQYRRRRKGRMGRRIKKGFLTNFIPVEVINAITGEVARGYMRDITKRRLKTWLNYHNTKAEAEMVRFPKNSTFANLDHEDLRNNFPILIKLGKQQYPYVIVHTVYDMDEKGLPIFHLHLKTVDNLKYLEIVTDQKKRVMELFNKIKAEQKEQRKANAKKKAKKRHTKRKRSR